MAGSFTGDLDRHPHAVVGRVGDLPSGVTFADNGNGTASLSGTPATGTGGSYPITITADNGVGNPGSQSFTLTVDEAPGFTSSDAATFTAGHQGSFTVRTRGFPDPAISKKIDGAPDNQGLFPGGSSSCGTERATADEEDRAQAVRGGE